MFTDTEVGMAMSHNRQMRVFANDAQRLVDELDRDIISLRSKLKAALGELANERALRLSLEMKLKALGAR